MENKSPSKLPDRQNYLPDVIGFAIAIIHFVTAYLVTNDSPFDMSFRYHIGLVLLTPGYLLSLIIDSFPSVSEFINSSASDTFLRFFFMIVSSLFYGITGSFLVSESKIKQGIGIFLVGLLIIFGCYLMLLAAQYFA
ncbi:MAG: hypothetical protein EHM33_13670 [Chloroflexi bacterium]|nr:MAG: hypothetical protein EHM33_13670 [Chloroflexota bacterium]